MGLLGKESSEKKKEEIKKRGRENRQAGREVKSTRHLTTHT